MRRHRYTIFHKDVDGGYYLFNQLYRSFLQVDKELYEALEEEHFGLIDSEGIATLKELHFIIEQDSLSEEELIQAMNIRARYQNDALRITIIPTMNCNFRCWYCYEQHKRSVLSAAGVKSIITFIKHELTEKRKKLLILDWFGGEPLLRFYQTMVPLTKDLLDWCHAHEITLHNQITTNGSLIDDMMAKTCAEIHLSQFQITLDGGPSHHNKTRFSANMRNSYERIVQGIHSLCSHIEPLSLDLRINYTPENIESIDDILYSFSSEDRRKITLSPHIVWQKATFAKALSPKIEAFKDKAKDLGYAIRSDDMSIQCTSCYVENVDQYVINYDLNVYKCTARDFSPKDAIGRINSEGRFLPTSLYHRYYIEPSPFINAQCLSCEVLPSCLCAFSCIQQKIEGAPFICHKELITQGIHRSIQRKLSHYVHT